MIILQIDTLTDSLRFRRSEWGAALATALIGLILAQPYPTFSAPSFAIMASWASEATWGTSALILGLIRLGVLIYNGRWRRCSHARMALAGLSCFLWAALVYGLAGVGVYPTEIAPYLVFFAMDLHTIYEAGADARIVDEARRAAPA
jgi:hypothetical protein